jgi:hypothetical protein
MQAFHGDIAVKENCLDMVREARALAFQSDANPVRFNILSRPLPSAFLGESCKIERFAPEDFPKEFGIPAILASLQNAIYHSLNLEPAMEWPEQFFDAVQPGANLDGVWDKFALWMLSDPDDGLLTVENTINNRVLILTVVNLYRRKIAGETIDVKYWIAAGDEAGRLADRTSALCARSAAYVQCAARDVHEYAWDAYFRFSHYFQTSTVQARERHAAKLLQLLREAPMTTTTTQNP